MQEAAQAGDLQGAGAAAALHEEQAIGPELQLQIPLHESAVSRVMEVCVSKLKCA